MKYELIIVRYGEIALKGKETRKRFENTLVSNIKNAFSTENLSGKISKEWGRIYVHTTMINKCIDLLQRIFGITSVSPAFQTTSDMGSMSKLAIDISKEKLNAKKSFAIRVTRTGDHKFTSQDVAIKIGDELVKGTNASVDLTKPDFELFVEIRNDKAFLFTEKIRCAGGMPLGTQGNILALIDSSESILAAWYIMKRGCKTVFLNADKSVSDVLYTFIEQWYTDQDIVMVNAKKTVYECINDTVSKRNCAAIVTGHCFCDSSNTILQDLILLNENVTIPLLHPLIAMEKEEIHKKCKELGILL